MSTCKSTDNGHIRDAQVLSIQVHNGVRSQWFSRVRHFSFHSDMIPARPILLAADALLKRQDS